MPNYFTNNSNEIIQSNNTRNASKVGETVKGLKPDTNLLDRQKYEEARKRLIGHFEDQKHPNGTTRVYDDSIGNRTVGIGFNMDHKGARNEWNKAFSVLPENERPDFDAVREERVSLSQKNIDILFDYSINDREKDLIKQFGRRDWESLDPRIRLVVESLRYGGGFQPSRINKDDKTEPLVSRHCFTGEHTEFFKDLKEYIRYKRLGDLEMAKLYRERALWQVLYGSNAVTQAAHVRNGLQDRRNAEAMLANIDDYLIVKKRGPEQIRKEIFNTFNQRITNTIDTVKRKYIIKKEDVAFSLRRLADTHARLHERLIVQNTERLRRINDPQLVDRKVKDFVNTHNKCTEGICNKLEQDARGALSEAALYGRPLSALEEAVRIDLLKLERRMALMTSWVCSAWLADLTRERHLNCDVTHYIWRTQGDGRVRHSHADRAGHIFAWGSAHDDGHPGEAPGCRCWAEPYSMKRYYSEKKTIMDYWKVG